MLLKNFKYKAVFISSIVVLAIYILLVIFVPPYDRSVDQPQTNRLKCENYLADASKYTVVCVGSSEMYRVKVDKIDPSWFNLGLSGNDSLTGLELITKSGKIPEIVIIEINDTIVRGTDYEIVEKAISPGLNRVKYRPDYLLYCIYRTVVDRLVSGQEGRSINETLIQVHIKENSKECDQDKLNSALDELYDYIVLLKKNGTEVYLVEMPNDYRLYNTAKVRNVREKAYEKFPLDKYNWITCNWKDYQTQDGIHLCYEDASNYAKYLYDMIN